MEKPYPLKTWEDLSPHVLKILLNFILKTNTWHQKKLKTKKDQHAIAEIHSECCSAVAEFQLGTKGGAWL